MAGIASINSMNPLAIQTPVPVNFAFPGLIFIIDTANCSEISEENYQRDKLSIRHRFIVEIVKEKYFEYLDTVIVTRIVARLTLFARSPAVLSMFLPIVN